MAVVADQSVEAQLRSAVRRHRRASLTRDQAEAHRDEAIKAALAAGLGWERIIELTGLSRARISQIHRQTRV